MERQASFLVAEYAKAQGIKPDTISTDIYRGNRIHGPVYSLANVMTKFLYLGYSLQEVVSAVTDHAKRMVAPSGAWPNSGRRCRSPDAVCPRGRYEFNGFRRGDPNR